MTSVGTHGQGGITKRRDGRLQVSITMANGRRVYRMVPAMADKRRQRQRADALRRDLITARDLDLDPSSQTVADYLRSWLDSMASAVYVRQRPRTLEFYEMVIERHIIPALGRYRLDRLSERNIQAWIDADEGSPRSVHHHRAVLRRALNVAMRKRIIARNPALAIDLPEVDDTGGSPLTADEAHRLIAATRKDRLGALWHLAVVTGMRQGELLGLAWEDVDFGGNDGLAGTAVAVADGGVGNRGRRGTGADHRRGPSITVRHQLARENGEWVRRPPKTAKGRRTIPLTALGVEALRAQRAMQREWMAAYYGGRDAVSDETVAGRAHRRERFGVAVDAENRRADRADGGAQPAMAVAPQRLARRPVDQLVDGPPVVPIDGLVFTTAKGHPLHETNVVKYLAQDLAAAGLPHVTNHDLRHTAASLLWEMGVPTPAIADILGHSTTRLVEDLYRHRSQKVQEEAAARMQEALGG